MRRPEQALQVEVARFLGHALKPPTIWTAFPAGGGGRVRGAFLKAMGLKAGWPDILVIHPTIATCGVRHPTMLGIELKAKKGSLSAVQKAVRSSFDAAGVPYLTARSVDDVESLLETFGFPLHARLS